MDVKQLGIDINTTAGSFGPFVRVLASDPVAVWIALSQGIVENPMVSLSDSRRYFKADNVFDAASLIR
jgi:hypothetical protein